MSEVYIIAVGFFIISLIYASVGFGGGSSYLALLAVMGASTAIIRPTALLCNLVVVTGGVYIFYREHKIDWRRNWPFLAASIPMAFLGGYWRISDNHFYTLLGFTLVVASCFLWMQPEKIESERKSDSMPLNIGLGAGVGLLSGLVSIGGGIFLAPILHLIRWDEARKISALASLFILVNSISGLAGQLTRSASIDYSYIFPLLIAVFLGGQIGSRLGARRFNPLYIKRITAILILAAGLNILKNHLF